MSTCHNHLEDNVGLVVALPAEARSLGAHGMRAGGCTRWAHGWIAVSGVGHHNAMRAAEQLLACGVTGLANWGVAGALDDGLAPGDLLIPERILHADNDPRGFTPDPATRAHLADRLAADLRIHGGTLWSAAQPVATRADKRALTRRTGAIAVDMEAAAVAAVAARANLPFVVVKAICDPAGREVPARVARALGRNGGVSLGLVSAIALGGPGTWRATRDLAQDFAHARRALATASRLASLAA